MDFGLLLLRSVVGLTLAAHGARSLFGWFGGPGFEVVAKGFEGFGFRPGRRHAALAGTAELCAGLTLAAGLLTPAAAAVSVSVMLVAAIAVNAKHGFFVTAGGFEYNLVLGTAALSLAFTGAGRFSVDALLGYAVSGVRWGSAALLLGMIGAGVQLAQRRPAGKDGAKAAA